MDVALPKQVQRQLDELAELEKPPEASATPETPSPETPAPADPPKPVEPAPPPAPKAGDDWEQKYKTLQGIFDAERTRAQAAAKTLQDQVASLTQSIEELKAAKAAEPAPASITDKDIDAFGGDLLDVIKRQASDVVAQERAQWQQERAELKRELATLKGTATTAAETSSQVRRDRYNAELSKLHPDFQAINATEEFKAYCREIDPVWGVPRQNALSKAWEDFDPAATARYFDAYKAAKGIKAPVEPPPERDPKAELEAQVQPSRRKSSVVTPDSSTEKVWSTAEIDRFYRDLGRGAYRGKDEEARTIEAQIDLAVAQGRVK